jgi:DNA-binding transcriptional MerR regulator
MSDDPLQIPTGELAARTGMRTARIPDHESLGLLQAPERMSEDRRHSREVFHRLAIIDAARRLGFTPDEICDLLGSRDRPAHERARRLRHLERAEIEHAAGVCGFLETCSSCDCESLNVCGLFDERNPGRLCRLRAHGSCAPVVGVH